MKPIVTVIAIALTCLSTPSDLLACGQKYIVPSRGTRFERPPSRRQPAAILLYANPGSELSRRLVTLSVGDALRKAGYRATIATDAREFTAALGREHWDVVIVDVADVPAVSPDRGDRMAASIVPVTYTTSGPEWNQAKRQYPTVVKAPGRARAFVDVVDATLDRQTGHVAPPQR